MNIQNFPAAFLDLMKSCDPLHLDLALQDASDFVTNILNKTQWRWP